MVLRKSTRRPRRMMRKRRPLNRRRKVIRRPLQKRTTDYAKLVEIQETQLIAVGTAAGESVGGQISFTLADYQRPQEVAHAYKYYRASKCEVSFIPYYNVSQTQTGVGARLPQLYFTVDRIGNQWIAPTESEMLSRGVSPVVFNKKRTYTFKPNLLQIIDLEAVTDSGSPGAHMTKLGAVNSTPLFNKWLPTQQTSGFVPMAGQVGQIVPKAVNPYALRYYGAMFCPAVEGLAASSLPVGDIQIKITWEFKCPRALLTNAPLVEPNPVYATSTNVDGVVANTQPTTYP